MTEPESDDLLGPDDLGALLLSLIADVKALNLKVATLHELLRVHAGVTDAQYDAVHAQVTTTLQAMDGPLRAKH